MVPHVLISLMQADNLTFQIMIINVTNNKSSPKVSPSLLVTMGHPKFIPKTAPFPSKIHTSTNPIQHPKQHLDPIGRFATIPS